MINLNEKVRIRKDLQADMRYSGIYCHTGMLKFKGKEVTIGNFPYEERNDVFNINEDLEGYLWSYRMLER